MILLNGDYIVKDKMSTTVNEFEVEMISCIRKQRELIFRCSNGRM